ncbi:MAG: BolA family protein [Pseudomonadota bacterium]
MPDINTTDPHPTDHLIREKLTLELEPRRLDVLNESELHAGHRSSPGTGASHYRVLVVSDAFEGLSRVDRHRKINAILAEELAPGGVHALAIHAYAPGEKIRELG